MIAQDIDVLSDYRHYKNKDYYKILAIAHDLDEREFILYCPHRDFQDWAKETSLTGHYAVDITDEFPVTYKIVHTNLKPGICQVILERTDRRVTKPSLFLRTHENFFGQVEDEEKALMVDRFEALPPF